MQNEFFRDPKDGEENDNYIAPNLQELIESQKELERENKEREDNQVSELLRQNQPEEKFTFEFNKKPKEVKEYLDRFVISQDRAKKILSNAVCYHFKRVARENNKSSQSVNGHIKKNVLLVGNTGVGKTYIVNKLSQLIGVPFVKADMTKFSSTGYVGGNVDDVIRDLYSKSKKNKKLTEIGMVYLDEFDKIATYSAYVGKDVNGLEVQRELLKLLEETEIDVNPTSVPLGIMPIRQKEGDGKINTKNILFICSGAFPGIENIVKKRLGQKDNWKEELTAYDFVDYGLEAELVGRLPIRSTLDDLNKDDLYKILTTSEDSIIPRYQEDFKEYGIELTFTDGALKKIAEKASNEKTGARALVGAVENILLEFMYELPSTEIKELKVTTDLIRDPKGYFNKIIKKEEEEKSQEPNPNKSLE